jgi:kynurenine 3-monooxygenase
LFFVLKFLVQAEINALSHKAGQNGQSIPYLFFTLPDCYRGSTMTEKKYAVVGAGLVGSLLSVILARKGFHVDVLERRPDMRSQQVDGGRSINLALSTRGLKALEAIGLEEEVRKLCIPMHGRMIHDEKGGQRLMPYGKEGQFINSVSRGDLNRMLLEKADESLNVQLYFDERCEHVDCAKGEVFVKNTHSGENRKLGYDAIFGTDGAFSSVRLGLMKTDMFDFEYRQDYLEHGYKELSIPPAEGGGWRLEKNALHIWPRKSFMMIALPNMDGSFTCTLFLALKGKISFEKLHSEKEIEDFFQKYFPDALAQMPTLKEDFFHNPASSLVTAKCYPWHYDGKVLLMGDAAHPIVPFYGQGMNAGFEDCTVLSELMEKSGTDWNNIFPAFTESRKPNADAVAELALMNFIEMRDLVADPHFILKNRISKRLSELFPEKWTTMYAMVTFTHMGYAEALALGQRNDGILEKIVKENNDIEQLIDSEEAGEKLAAYV